MISDKLIQEIKTVRKTDNIITVIFFTLVLCIVVYFGYEQNGFQNWMYLCACLPILLILFGKVENKALQILEKTPDQIKHIVLEEDDSKLEIEVHLKDKNYNYSLNLPFEEGLEIAQKLMVELPDIDFYDDYKNKISNINEAKF